mmetsp:Transcript_14126/g.29942  ORF Transcript_14126/g.29942 Transcript_14126/m.29942 type:complete len:529 (-) Transcript_14126:82-1668(-)
MVMIVPLLMRGDGIISSFNMPLTRTDKDDTGLKATVLLFLLAISLGLVSALDHGHEHDDNHYHHKHDTDSARRLGIFDGPPCNGSEGNFTVGDVAYECKMDFIERGGNCRTPERTAEEEVLDEDDFRFWKEAKKSKAGKGRMMMRDGRRLEGCVNCVNWETDIITVPTYFHVIRDGSTGQKYVYNDNPEYIENQIKVLNLGFRGEIGMFPQYNGRSYPRYREEDSDTRIQFCLMGTTETNNRDFYQDNNENAMKTALRRGGMETLNVFVNTAGGYLGYAYFPESSFSVNDGVTLLNDSLPGGDISDYNEGDTLTHEVGHWLNLDHTHFNGCKGPGDYMNEAPPGDYVRQKTNEDRASFGCPIGRDNCNRDSGQPNPIHNFMSYVDDDCMDEFSPGQVVKMRAAWELYRHKENYSEFFSLASDGVKCVFGSQETDEPSPIPSGAPSVAPSVSFVPTAPFTDAPTVTKVPTFFPTGSPSAGPTLFPTGTPSGSPMVAPKCGVTGADCEEKSECCSFQCKKDKKTKTKACK